MNIRLKAWDYGCMSTTNPQNINLKCSLLSLHNPTLNFNLFLCTFSPNLVLWVHLYISWKNKLKIILSLSYVLPGCQESHSKGGFWGGAPLTHEVKRKEGRNYTVEIELGQSQAKDMGQCINPTWITIKSIVGTTLENYYMKCSSIFQWSFLSQFDKVN